MASTRRFLAALTVATSTCALLSCAVPPPPTVRARPAGWSEATLTRDGVDSFTLDGDERELTLRAEATNGGGNTRLVAWRDDLSGGDATACVTTDEQPWPTQEGVAVGISSTPDRTTALTVTRNVWGRATTVYNVHRWDTGAPASSVHLGSHQMVSALDGRPGAAHRLCARLDGEQLAFKVWQADQPEPSWTDPVAARSTWLPAEWREPGRAGVYLGHVEPGASLRLHDIALAAAEPTDVPR